MTDARSPVPSGIARRLNQRGIGWCDHAMLRGPSAARVLIAGAGVQIDAALLSGFPRLGLVTRTGAGFENIDTEALSRRGVPLLVPRVNADASVAEYTIGGLVALLRKLAAADAAVRAGDFGFRSTTLGTSVRGLTLGLIGAGRIGLQVIRLAQAFDMRVQVWHPWSDKQLPPGVLSVDSLATLLKSSDVVSVHCRLTADTALLIGRPELDAMPAHAVLINTARGHIVDEHALADAMDSRSIAGAVVDCFADESDGYFSPLARSPHVILSPHLAGLTVQSIEKISTVVVENVAHYLASGSVLDVDLVLS